MDSAENACARAQRERERRPEGDSEREGARELALAYGVARLLWQRWRWRIGERQRAEWGHGAQRGY